MILMWSLADILTSSFPIPPPISSMAYWCFRSMFFSACALANYLQFLLPVISSFFPIEDWYDPNRYFSNFVFVSVAMDL